MIVTVDKGLVEAIGYKHFEAVKLGKDAWSWKDQRRLNLAVFDDKTLTKLRDALKDKKDVDGAPELSRDINTWIAAKTDIEGAKPRTVNQFHSLLQHYMLDVEGQRLYQKGKDDVWLPYYVSKVTYQEADKRYNRPPCVIVTLVYEEFGGRQSDTETFHFEDVRGKTVAQTLLAKGYVAETKDLRKLHQEHVAKFVEVVKQVGKQYNAIGLGTDDVDGNPGSSDGNRYRPNTLAFGRDGDPGRVVVDVFYEGERGRSRDEKVAVDPTYWDRVKRGKASKGDDDMPDDAEMDVGYEPEVPLHPYLAVFDLGKHLRLRTHVANLTEYIYDDKLSEKLVLDKTMKDLVEMLVEHKDGGFQDIIKGKGGGAVILLGGKPGTGKTLTAEVYAESKHMPLYNVQCSQLGIEADHLEAALLKVFQRSKRWNAIVLLDEADVYIRERGLDLEQNAIVGVLLRVLEYMQSVLFLATNRPDEVDDAIASRCLARLSYELPTEDLEAQIWQVLSRTAGAKISPENIRRIISEHKMKAGKCHSGRDVKNLLKLAMLVEKGKPITSETIEFVSKFRPWTDGKED
jgi:hypothetical protein